MSTYIGAMQSELTEAQRVVSHATSQVGLLVTQGSLPAPWLGHQGRAFRSTVAAILRDAAASLAQAHRATYDVELTCVERGVRVPHLDEAEQGIELSARRASKAARLFAASEFTLNQAKPSAKNTIADLQRTLTRLHGTLTEAHTEITEAVAAFPAHWPTLQEALRTTQPTPKSVKLPEDVLSCLPLTVSPTLMGTVCLLHTPILVDKDPVPRACYLLAVKEGTYRKGGWTLIRRIVQSAQAPWLGTVAALNVPKRRQGYCVFPLMREPCTSWAFVR